MHPFLLTLAILPGLLISIGIFWVDKYEREGFVPLLCCFALGALATWPAVQAETYTFAQLSPHRHLAWATFLLAFAAIACNEELWKGLVLLAAAFPYRFFNEPLDGIVYAVLVAMGFATMENILYAYRFGFDTIVVRAFTAVPAHLVFGIVVGYFAGLAKFQPARRYILLAQGFGLAILLHGAYDVLIIQRWSDWLLVLATLALYLSLFFCSRLIQIHLENSPFRRSNAE